MYSVLEAITHYDTGEGLPGGKVPTETSLLPTVDVNSLGRSSWSFTHRRGDNTAKAFQQSVPSILSTLLHDDTLTRRSCVCVLVGKSPPAPVT